MYVVRVAGLACPYLLTGLLRSVYNRGYLSAIPSAHACTYSSALYTRREVEHPRRSECGFPALFFETPQNRNMFVLFPSFGRVMCMHIHTYIHT